MLRLWGQADLDLKTNSTAHYRCDLCKKCPLCALVYKNFAMEGIDLLPSELDALSCSVTM